MLDFRVFAKYFINKNGYLLFKKDYNVFVFSCGPQNDGLKDKILACQSKALFGHSYYVFLSR